MQTGRARPLGMQVLPVSTHVSTHLSTRVSTRVRTGMQVLGQHGSDWVGAAASAVARCSVVLVFSLSGGGQYRNADMPYSGGRRTVSVRRTQRCTSSLAAATLATGFGQGFKLPMEGAPTGPVGVPTR